MSESPTHIWVYFELNRSDHDEPAMGTVEDVHAEYRAMTAIWCLLRDYVDSSRLRTEGYDAHGVLICFVLVRQEQLRALHRRIEMLHGGGDDIIYLDGMYHASQFQIVEHSGLTQPIPFYMWDDYLEG